MYRDEGGRGLALLGLEEVDVRTWEDILDGGYWEKGRGLEGWDFGGGWISRIGWGNRMERCGSCSCCWRPFPHSSKAAYV